MVFSFGTSKDAPDVLRLLEDESYQGDLRIIFTRRDDPIASYKAENDGSITGMIRDNEGRAIATMSAIPRQMYIGGELKKTAYLSGLKKDLSYKKMINWRDVFAKMDAAGKYDAYFCCFVGDNDLIIRMLGKKRARLPYTIPVSSFDAFIYSPHVRIKDPHPELEFIKAEADDKDAAVKFINEQGKRHDLFHKLDSVDDVKGLDKADFYCLKKDGKIVAAGALWDRKEVKQYYLKECHGKMKLVRFLNPVLSLIGYIKIPPDNTRVNFAYISFLEAENDDPGLITSLLSRIKEEAKSSYDALFISAAHSSKKHGALKKIRGIRITHHIVQIVMNGINDVPPADIDGENMDIECALL